MDFATILAVAASQGGGAAAVSLGPELVTNGGYDADTDWDKGTGVTIAAGKLNLATASSASTTQNGSPPTDVLLRTVYTSDSISLGSVRLNVGDATGTLRSSPGTYTEDLLTTVDEGLLVEIAATVATTAVIDNVSIKQIL
jgi:hypothetical protein